MIKIRENFDIVKMTRKKKEIYCVKYRSMITVRLSLKCDTLNDQSVSIHKKYDDKPRVPSIECVIMNHKIP